MKTGDIADIGKDEDFEGRVNDFLRLVGGIERQFQAAIQIGFISPLLCRRGNCLDLGLVFYRFKR